MKMRFKKRFLPYFVKQSPLRTAAYMNCSREPLANVMGGGGEAMMASIVRYWREVAAQCGEKSWLPLKLKYACYSLETWKERSVDVFLWMWLKFFFLLETSKFICGAGVVNSYLLSLLFCQDVFLPLGRSFDEFAKCWRSENAFPLVDRVVHPAQLQPRGDVGLYCFLSHEEFPYFCKQRAILGVCVWNSPNIWEGRKPYLLCATAGKLPFDLLRFGRLGFLNTRALWGRLVKT